MKPNLAATSVTRLFRNNSSIAGTPAPPRHFGGGAAIKGHKPGHVQPFVPFDCRNIHSLKGDAEKMTDEFALIVLITVFSALVIISVKMASCLERFLRIRRMSVARWTMPTVMTNTAIGAVNYGVITSC